MNRRGFLRGSALVSASAILPHGVAETTRIAAASEVASETAGAAFPKGFLWGSATASYQVEGAVHEDGRGETIWDRFSHSPAKIRGAATGDVACDHYHRYKEDITLMKQLGMKSCRFSIAWSRIQPTGRGAANQRGLDHYSRVVDTLLAAGIRPMVTLFHWDLPQALEDEGGWPNRELAGPFAEYAGIVTKSLGDRVTQWAIFNEPWCISMLGYGIAFHAPGRASFPDYLKAAHTLNLSQGEAFRAMKAIRPEAKIGGAYSVSPGTPKTDSEADRAAAARYHAHNNVWFLEAAIHGRYPKAFVGETPFAAMNFKTGDEDIMRAPLDWIGVNYYNRHIISASGDQHAKGPDPSYNGLGFDQPMGAEGPLTENGWEVWPQGMYDIVMQLHREYGLPMEITENGCAYSDSPDVHGRVPDTRRIEFLRRHLTALQHTIRDGADVRGYHAWSLMDNFEWEQGYSQRFGLTYIDYRDQRRIVKDSGYYYQRVIAANAVVA
jgi:beta-glucosidase